MSELDNKG